jgi:hypothetical protein
VRSLRAAAAAVFAVGVAVTPVALAGPASAGSSGQAATVAYAYPAGWSDDCCSASTYDDGYERDVTAIQVYREYASNNSRDTITAVRARCSIRNERPDWFSGVKIHECALGIDGGALLTVGGEFLDGGTCCANGFSPFRYAKVPPSACCTGFLARGTYVTHRISDNKYFTFNRYSIPTGHIYILTS